MSTGYERQDQLTQWLIVCINISDNERYIEWIEIVRFLIIYAMNHIAYGNQVSLNLTDIIQFTIEYATIGLAVEESSISGGYAKRSVHFSQHQVRDESR